LAVFFAVFFFLREALAAILVRFVLAFVDDLLNLVVFLLRLAGRQRLVILGSQPLDQLSIDLQDLQGPRFGLLHSAVPIEFVCLFALDVGVIALPFIVFQVSFLGAKQQFPNLLQRDRARGVGLKIQWLKINGRPDRSSWRRSGSRSWGRSRVLTKSAARQQNKREEGYDTRTHDRPAKQPAKQFPHEGRFPQCTPAPRG